MEPTNLTIEILKGIRTDLHDLRTDLHDLRDEVRSTNTRLDATNTRLDTLESSLGRRIVESEVRTATAITELAGSVRDLTDLLRTQHDLRPRVEKCELEIARLKDRLPDA